MSQNCVMNAQASLPLAGIPRPSYPRAMKPIRFATPLSGLAVMLVGTAGVLAVASSPVPATDASRPPGSTLSTAELYSDLGIKQFHAGDMDGAINSFNK